MESVNTETCKYDKKYREKYFGFSLKVKEYWSVLLALCLNTGSGGFAGFMHSAAHNIASTYW